MMLELHQCNKVLRQGFMCWANHRVYKHKRDQGGAGLGVMRGAVLTVMYSVF